MSTPSPSDNNQPHFRLRSPNAPPTFQIDLSQPPRKRYTALCTHFRVELQNLVGIYDDVLTFTPYPWLFAYIAKIALRRVKSSEETEELKGISEASGVPLHLVVAYNTFLDLFSGCVSGGVRVRDAGAGAVGKEEEEREGGIVHFRGLDWEMEPLRDLMVCLEYVREGKVVARAVTYAGYIGVLTGVRKGLSISLNYRPKLDSPSSTFSHRLHQLRMLLGFKANTPSILRSFLLSPQTPTLDEIKAQLENTPTAPCYLTFCSSKQVMVVEKDLHALKSEISDRFLAVTNHDLHMESWSTDEWVTLLRREKVPDVAGVKDILGDSIERKRCVEDLWKGDLEPRMLGVRDVRRWLSVWPVRNETTHFVCVMDPCVDGGGLVWVEGYVEPVMPPQRDSDEDSSDAEREES